jgi:hypothetical protein
LTSPSWQQGKLTLVDSRNIVRLSGPLDIEEQKHVRRGEKVQVSALTWVPGFWLLRAAIAVADPVELVFCWKWIRPRGKRKTSPAFRVVEKSVSARNEKSLNQRLTLTHADSFSRCEQSQNESSDVVRVSRFAL